MPQAMFTVFTLGILADWTDIVAPVCEKYSWAPIFFIAYVLLANFAVLNLVIGVIAEKTASVQQGYAEQRQHEDKKDRMRKIEQIADIFFAERDECTKRDIYDIMQDEILA